MIVDWLNANEKNENINHKLINKQCKKYIIDE